VEDWENIDIDVLADKVKNQPDKIANIETKDDEVIEEVKKIEKEEMEQISSLT